MAAKSTKKAKSKIQKKAEKENRARRFDFSYTQNRELSWLRFDERVLDEAYDESVPLFERLKFVSIFESNLDEFFMIRIGGLSDLATLKRQPLDNKTNLTPAEQIDRVFETLPPLIGRWTHAFHSIESKLEKRGVRRVAPSSLSAEERLFVERYFQAYVSPVISPLVIDPRHPFPNLRNNGLYLVCALEGGDDESNLLGLIEIPQSMNRVVEMPHGTDALSYILLEDVILTCLDNCFGVYRPLDRAVIRVTRNADIDPDGEGVEEEEDYRQHMKRILKKRLRLQPVCLTVSGSLEKRTLKVIRAALELPARSILRCDIPLDLGYVFAIEGRLPDELKPELLFKPFRPQPSPMFEQGRSIREQVIEGDKLLFYPYESMNTLLDLVHEAAFDPDCFSLRITLYRVAKQSRLCESLIDAAENGKEVTVLMELRARFDEQNNIEWAERLEEAGCTVIYGSEGFKCHSKICQLTYREGMALTRITLLGTGNFNEKTARLYSDFMLMTAHPGIGEDASAFFRNLSLGSLRGDYRYLGVAPAGLKPLILRGLNREIERALSGEPARVFFKLNSLTDREVIDKIAEASRAGVRVDMIIRGISCLLPGIPGKTDNVHIRSIVGRFLEHARVYAFGVDADTVYLSSADMMTRNTEHRVEIAYPVLDPACRALVHDYMDAQLRDNTKARELSCMGVWEHVARAEGEEPFNSQEYLLDYVPRRALAAAQAEEAAEAVYKGKHIAPMEALATAGPVAPEPVPEPVEPPVPEPEPAPAVAPEAEQEPTVEEEPFAAAEPVPAVEPAAPAAAPAPESPTGEAADTADSAPSPADVPAAAHAVRATIIEPEPAPEPEPEAAPKPETSTAAGADTVTIAIRRHGRVRTGFALIGLGIKTIFGKKRRS